MKKRRTLIIALLLVAALCLGIGYAAYSVNMEISGTATAGAPSPLVTFSNVDVVNKTETVGVTSLGTTGGQSIDLNLANFANATDYCTVRYTVHNGHDFDVTLSDITSTFTNSGTNYPSHFEVTIDDSALDAASRLVPAGGEITFDVTVKLNKTFATDASILQNFRIDFTATGVVPQ